MSKTNKFIIWCAIVGIVSFWMWAGVQVWLRAPLFDVSNYTNLAITTALFLILITLLSLSLIIFHSRSASIYLASIVSATYLLLFKISNLNLVGIFILVILFFHAEDIIAREMKERVKIHPGVLSRWGLHNFVISFFILASFAAYQSPAIDSFKNQDKLPPSGEAFIRTVIDQGFSSQIQAPPEEKEAIVEKLSQETTHRINTFIGPYFDYVPPILAFGLFLILWGFSWLVILISVGLGIVLFNMLKKINFVKIEEYDTKAERVTT